jgi:hypothetical protein
LRRLAIERLDGQAEALEGADEPIGGSVTAAQRDELRVRARPTAGSEVGSRSRSRRIVDLLVLEPEAIRVCDHVANRTRHGDDARRNPSPGRPYDVSRDVAEEDVDLETLPTSFAARGRRIRSFAGAPMASVKT